MVVRSGSVQKYEASLGISGIRLVLSCTCMVRGCVYYVDSNTSRGGGANAYRTLNDVRFC